MTAENSLGSAAERIEIYKLLVEMADRVSQRRQAANSFYLSVNTLLVGGSAYLGTLKPDIWNLAVISIAGVAICGLWAMNIISYKTLNAAKFEVIQDLEKSLAAQPFAAEWSRLTHDGDGKRHRPFHKVEAVVPWVFVAVYLTQTAAVIPWLRLGQAAFCN